MCLFFLSMMRPFLFNHSPVVTVQSCTTTHYHLRDPFQTFPPDSRQTADSFFMYKLVVVAVRRTSPAAHFRPLHALRPDARDPNIKLRPYPSLLEGYRVHGLPDAVRRSFYAPFHLLPRRSRLDGLHEAAAT